MTRQNWLILLFGVAVLAYGLSQYWEQERSPVFKAALLDFLPKEVEKIAIHPLGEVPYRLLRRQGRWLLTAEHVNEPANQEMVSLLLNRLRSIRTDQIVTNQSADWSTYGLADGQGTRVCLETAEQRPQCIQIGTYEISRETRRMNVFARIPSRDEVYSFDGLRLNFFSGKMDAFRLQQLTDLTEIPTALRWLTTADTLTAKYASQRWQFSPTMLPPDSLQWLNYLSTLLALEAPAAANDFDELALDSLLTWQLALETEQEIILIRAFQDSLRTPAYLLHSTQFPTRWLAADSLYMENLTWPWVEEERFDY